MFFDLFVKSAGSISSLQRAASELRNSGAFAALAELGHTRSLTIATPAASKHWNDGYQEALKDIFHFEERYIGTTPTELPRADFSVAANLFKTNEIDKAEYERLTGRKPGAL